jgi:hypothetical protein
LLLLYIPQCYSYPSELYRTRITWQFGSLSRCHHPVWKVLLLL